MSEYLDDCRSPFWQEVFKKETDYILRYLKDKKNMLSVGCGPAFIEKGLQECGFNITGLDVSEEALDGAPDSIRTVVGRAEDMQFDKESFESAIFVASLQFMDDYKKAIKETSRVLEPKGEIIIMLLNTDSVYFEQMTEDKDSYMNKIKHKNISRVENALRDHFMISGEYYLGIDGEKIFDSNDPKRAALYVIKGIKK